MKSDTAPQFDVMLAIDVHGRITAVVLVDHREPKAKVDVDVVGDSAAYATARLRSFGLDATTVDADLSCAQRGQVVDATEHGIDAVTLQVSRENAACAG